MAAREKITTQRTWADVLKEHKDTFEGVFADPQCFTAWWSAAIAWCISHPVKNIDSVTAFVDAYMDAARRNLLIDGKECMVQVRGKAGSKTGPQIKCEVGYRGIIKQAGYAGITLDAHAIHEGDDIDLDEGAGTVRHQRAFVTGQEEGKILGFYCVITCEKTGNRRIVTMSVADVEKRSTDTSFWTKWPVEMGKKSVILQAGKVLHFSDEAGEMARIASSFSDPGEEVPPSSSARDHVLAQARRDQQDAEAEAGQEGPADGDYDGDFSGPPDEFPL